MGRFKKYVKKQFSRAKKWAKSRYGTRGGLGRLVKDVSMLKTAINSEKKYHDVVHVSGTTTITDVAPAIYYPWNGLVRGTEAYERLGDQIKALRTNIRFGLECNSADLTAAVSSLVRIMVIVDTEARGGAIHTAANMIQAVLQNYVTAQEQMRSPYRVDNDGTAATVSGVPGNRFKILRDFKLTLDNVNRKMREVNITIDHTKYSKRFRGQKLKYNDTTNVTVDDTLMVLIFTDNPSVTATMQLAGVQSRLCFVDN